MIKNDREYLIGYKSKQWFDSYPLYKCGFMWGQQIHLEKMLSDYEEKMGDKDRIGDWNPTFSGKRFWTLDPREEEIDPFDICYGLSRIPRFNGNTVGDPYYVGQHCVMGVDLIEDEFKLHFLLHDATENYVHDIITPVKTCLGETYSKIEKKIENCIAKKHNIEWTEKAHKRVKEIDIKMLVNEMDSLTSLAILPDVLPCLPTFKITPWDSKTVFNKYKEKFKELTGIEIPSVEEVLCQLKNTHLSLVQEN